MTQSDKAEAATRPAESARINAAVIDSIEVALEAHLGDARLTVAELGALEPGSVIPLEAALNRAVELRLNGVPVGRGELVAVGDRFGVRLTELAK
jgi:flagellar motor switch protein FliN/FliY